MAQEERQKKLAVLIDADNASPTVVEPLLAEVAAYGVASIKRIYGDLTTPHLRGWKAVLLEHAIQPFQQFRYTVGKNATDSAMIIDAMDILFTERLDGFCLVSSDSDFTRLASRIRESGLTVYGFGSQKTPQPFVAACDKFIFTEILKAEEEDNGRPRVGGRELKQDTKLVNLIRDAIEDSADEDGWTHLGAVGQYISNRQPAFDPRNYGYKKLGELVEAVGLFEVDRRRRADGPGANIYVRDKRRR